MIKRMIAGLAVVAWAAWSGSAMAGTIDMRLVSFPAYQQTFKYIVGSSARETRLGIFTWECLGNTGGGDYPHGIFKTVCIEIDQYVQDTTYEVIYAFEGPRPGTLLSAGPMGFTKEIMLEKLFGTYWGRAQGYAGAASAFQIAVWEIVYDNDNNVFKGDFRANYGSGPVPSYVTSAQRWIDSLSYSSPRVALQVLSNPNAQDQVTIVPLAPAAWGGLALLTGLGIGRLRRRRTTR